MKAPQEFTTGYCAREAVQQHKSHQTLANCPTVSGKSQQTLWHIFRKHSEVLFYTCDLDKVQTMSQVSSAEIPVNCQHTFSWSFGRQSSLTGLLEDCRFVCSITGRYWSSDTIAWIRSICKGWKKEKST